jgi:hypothetical protein
MMSISPRWIIHRLNVCVNIAVSQANGVLRVVGARGEMEKDPVLSGFLGQAEV